MSPIEYLTLDDALRLVRDLRAGPVRDLGLLDSALSRARSSAFGEDSYPTLELKAAALLHSLARNHPLVDGNKRLAWLASVVFVDLNGARPAISHDAAFDLVMGVSEGRVDVAEIAQRLGVRDGSRPG